MVCQGIVRVNAGQVTESTRPPLACAPSFYLAGICAGHPHELLRRQWVGDRRLVICASSLL